MKDFLISYNRNDRQWAEWIAWQLEESGYTTVIQAWDFGAGSDFVEEMDQAASQTLRTVAVLSDHYLASEYCAAEWHAAFADDPTGKLRKLVPVRVRECDPEGLLKVRNYIDLVGLDEAAAKEMFLAKLKNERTKPTSAPPFPAPSASLPASERSVTGKPRFPGALPPVWNVPHQPNPHFVGRAALLEAMHEALSSTRAAALTAIHGLGGVGKTQLATEYAYQRAAEYEIVWWVRAEETATLASDFSALAAQLGLPEQDAGETPLIVEAVRRALAARGGWLLVFDNARGAEDLRGYLPGSRTGHVLITSRDANWGQLARKLEVTTLAPANAAQFLLARTGQRDAQAAAELAEALGYLPLALEQAAAYIEAVGETLAGYRELFRTRRQELWPNERPPAGYPDTVATTWLISFAEAQQQNPVAADSLRLCAFLAPNDIPLQMLHDDAKHLPEPLAAAVSDQLAFNKAIAALRRYSLIEKKNDNLSVHRLVQLVTRDQLSEEEQKKWAKAAVGVIDAAFQYSHDNLQTWSACSRLLLHAFTATEHIQSMAILTENAIELLIALSRYLIDNASFSKTQTILDQALTITQTIYPHNHHKVAVVLYNFGHLYLEQKKLAKALGYFKRALKIDECCYGSDHFKIVEYLNAISAVLHGQGRTKEAIECVTRALNIYENSGNDDLPVLAVMLNKPWRIY